MRECGRVQAEVMTELVCEHAGRVLAELSSSIANEVTISEVTAARERVQLVGVDHTDRVPVLGQVRGHGEVAPDRRG